jgi:hypothetical protein
LCARDLLRDFGRNGLEVYNSPQTNLGVALAALNQLEDTPAIWHLYANVHVATAQIEERVPRYSRSVASSYSRSRSERPRQHHCNKGSLELVAEEGRGENKVMQPANPTANAAANPAANAAANAPANAAANATGNVANAQANTTPRKNVGAQPSPVQANHTEGSQRRCIRDEVEIARRANYDCDHGVPDALDANNPVQATELQNMHDQ